MRYNVFVTTNTGSQPEHTHLRHSGIRPGKIESVFRETVIEEYERLCRGISGPEFNIDGYGSIEAMDVTMCYTELGLVITSVNIFTEVQK